MSKKNVTALLLAVATISVTACQKGSDSPKTPSGKELMSSDRSLMAKASSEGAAEVDRKSNRAFTKVFGGTSGADVQRFLDERIKYYFTTADLERFQIASGSFRYRSWQKTDAADRADEKESSEKGEVGASNLSAAMFVQGAIDGSPVVIRSGETEITFDTPRVGMMQMGPGYKSEVEVKGRKISIPASYRQAILVHEARHSDCSIETSIEDFQVARNSNSYREFLGKLKKIECGHLHALCASGTEFAGLPACDRQPWGSYSIGLLFQAARLKDATDPIEQRILESTVADTATRLQFKTEDMTSGKLGEPRMKSAKPKW